MALAAKLKKAKALGITFEEGYEPKEDELDKLIDAKMLIVDQQKAEDKIRKEAEKKLADEAKKTTLVIQDVDGHDVDQSDYFMPRLEVEIVDEKTPRERKLLPTTETAPVYFNKSFGMPVDREELVEAFLQFFPRKKGFLFYKHRDKEVYLVIVPLKYAKVISVANGSRPGDFQKHALSFVSEGSVNVDSLKLKLERIAKHSDISTEAIAR